MTDIVIQLTNRIAYGNSATEQTVLLLFCIVEVDFCRVLLSVFLRTLLCQSDQAIGIYRNSIKSRQMV